MCVKAIISLALCIACGTCVLQGVCRHSDVAHCVTAKVCTYHSLWLLLYTYMYAAPTIMVILCLE